MVVFDGDSALEDELEPAVQPRTSTARQSPSPRAPQQQGQRSVAQLTSTIERQLNVSHRACAAADVSA